jgi:hypothetical protein
MNDLSLLPAEFDPQPFYCRPLNVEAVPGPESVALFDQNGYDLTNLEIAYSAENGNRHSHHRNHTHTSLKRSWFGQQPKTQGSVLNHALIFERKAYSGAALEQLQTWAKSNPLLWKVARIRAKWGIDFSIDWADREGNVFEILHYEYDSFDYEEAQAVKCVLEDKFSNQDWDHAAQCVLKRKNEWHDLDFFAQSDWKANFFGLGPERFKMVLWD